MVYKMEQQYVKAFVLAGHSEFTLESEKTGKRYTYRVKRARVKKTGEPLDRWYIELLRGENNEQDWIYICWYKEGDLLPQLSSKSNFNNESKPFKAIEYFFEHIDDLPKGLNFYPASKCGRCRKKLTTPESIKRGLGPECAAHVGC